MKPIHQRIAIHPRIPATFGWLCVETLLKFIGKAKQAVASHLRVAVC